MTRRRSPRDPADGTVRAVSERPRFGDALVLAAILLAIGLLWWSYARAVPHGDAIARITQNGVTIREIVLSRVQAPETWEIASGEYQYHIRIEPGRIRFESADCPDQVCVQSGWMDRPGHMAACVPGRLLIRIDGEGGDVDVITR